jgi:hypothetical protein
LKPAEMNIGRPKCEAGSGSGSSPEDLRDNKIP